MMIVAVTLLSVLAPLCLLTWGLIRMVIKSRGKLVIESKAVAILLKIAFRVEYHPPNGSGVYSDSTDNPPPVEESIDPPGSTSISDGKSWIGGDDDVT
jgi:hypothetical protein